MINRLRQSTNKYDPCPPAPHGKVVPSCHPISHQRDLVSAVSLQQKGIAGRPDSGGNKPAGDRHDAELGPYDYSTRVLVHRPLEEYSLLHCLGYVFYAPLYLAGPTLTFNAYVSQASTELGSREVVLYMTLPSLLYVCFVSVFVFSVEP